MSSSLTPNDYLSHYLNEGFPLHVKELLDDRTTKYDVLSLNCSFFKDIFNCTEGTKVQNELLKLLIEYFFDVQAKREQNDYKTALDKFKEAIKEEYNNGEENYKQIKKVLNKCIDEDLSAYDDQDEDLGSDYERSSDIDYAEINSYEDDSDEYPDEKPGDIILSALVGSDLDNLEIDQFSGSEKNSDSGYYHDEQKDTLTGVVNHSSALPMV